MKWSVTCSYRYDDAWMSITHITGEVQNPGLPPLSVQRVRWMRLLRPYPHSDSAVCTRR